LGAAQRVSAADEFSGIPVYRKILPPATVPAHTWPKRKAAISMSDPREGGLFGLIGNRKGDCGSTLVSFQVLEDGSLANISVATPSGFPYMDKAALRSMKAEGRWEPATFEGRPVALWRLQRFKFGDEEGQCASATGNSADWQALQEEYNRPLLDLVKKAQAISEEARTVQQRVIDAQEAVRFKAEEPYRLALPPGASPLQAARKANDLYWNYLQCGSSRFVEGGDYLTEYRGVQVNYSGADELSRIDRANGYEWRFHFSFRCEMQRSYSLDGMRGWSPWRACEKMSTTVSKQHGLWQGEGLWKRSPRQIADCASIPR
jgi:TonB family protein